MSDASDYAAAFAELKRTVQPDTDPVLTYGDGVTPNAAMDLDAVLIAARRATTWAASTAYGHGQIVVPTVRNGRRYRVTQGGTSGAAEPTWPTSDYGAVTNGSSDPALTLEEDGAFDGSIYDLRAAKREAWRLKASKSVEYIGTDEQHIHDRCEQMARRFAPVGVG